MILPVWSNRAISIVNSILNKNTIVYEWGSGFSTVWLARKVKQVYSMEHEPSWYNQTWNLLDDIKQLNALVYLAQQDSEMYFNHISELGIQFDFIEVDGRNRVRCFKQSVNFLKQGGYIMLDDSHRDWYKEAFEVKGLELIHRIQADLGDPCSQEATIWRKT